MRLIAILFFSVLAFGQGTVMPILGSTAAPAGGGGGGHTIVTGFPVQASQANVTTTAKDTTGATLLVVICGHTGTTCTILDQANGSGGALNTWTARADCGSGSAKTNIFYALSPVTNANHTFTTTAGGGPPTIQVYAVTGTFSAFDASAEACNPSSLASTFNVGSVTPATSGEFLLSGADSNTALNSASVNNGFSTAFLQTNGAFELVASSYLLSSGNTAFNLQWTMDTSVDWSAVIAGWK